jgi:hypothetical protein
LSREQLDVDEPSIENVQALILHSMSYLLLGLGKKCWMRLGAAIRMTLALELHCEDSNSEASPLDKEIARRCFFTCYIMDRYSVCGSKRPMLIADESLSLRLPSRNALLSSGIGNTSCFFQNLPDRQVGMNESDNLIAMVIDAVRILGKANNYFQQGGVRGDSHFPWHPMSKLSAVVSELKMWDFRFTSINLKTIDPNNKQNVETWFLSWFICHLIYVRIYRALLPIAMGEDGFDNISGNNAWQAEVTALCLKHATRIVELADSAIAHEIVFHSFILYAIKIHNVR